MPAHSVHNRFLSFSFSAGKSRSCTVLPAGNSGCGQRAALPVLVSICVPQYDPGPAKFQSFFPGLETGIFVQILTGGFPEIRRNPDFKKGLPV
tara:strand:- start:782 stop:1060 length:279 start_codon:yes stop_codon:yes gene_type:complete